jgi:two-component system nitrate/nitrite response regulator NarL
VSAEAKAVSLVVIDDHTLFRSGLYELLVGRGLDVVGMTGQADETLPLVERHQPDIVLLDLRMGEIGGLEILQQIKRQYADMRVIILTTSIEKADVLRALKLGASGYLLKDMDPDHLVEMLKRAKDGETVVAQEFTGLLARAAVVKEEIGNNNNAYNLTPREMDILKHIARGESNKHIASELGIVDGTVKLHVRAVLKKLGVQTRVQAALLAVSERLCDDNNGH